METIVGIAIVATVKKLLDFVRYLMNLTNPDLKVRRKAIHSAITVLAAWIIGALSVITVAHTSFATYGQSIFGFAIMKVNLLTQILFGMSVGSSTGLFSDFTRAVDNTRSSAEPPLVPQLLNVGASVSQTAPSTDAATSTEDTSEPGQ